MISWEICRKEFAPDGALRDIYVFDTSIEHWKKLIGKFISAYQIEYCVDGEVQTVPASVDEIFKVHTDGLPFVRFQSAGVTFVCHFFCLEQIELDFVPQEVNSERAFNGLLSLLKLIGDSLNKRVILTYESDGQHPFLSYEASQHEFVYHPCQITP